MPVITQSLGLIARAAGAVGRFFGIGAARAGAAVARPVIGKTLGVLTGPAARTIGLGAAGAFIGTQFAGGDGAGVMEAIEQQGGSVISGAGSCSHR